MLATIWKTVSLLVGNHFAFCYDCTLHRSVDCCFFLWTWYWFLFKEVNRDARSQSSPAQSKLLHIDLSYPVSVELGHSGPSEDLEEAGSEVPGAVTVEVEEIHPLPPVSAYNSHNPLWSLIIVPVAPYYLQIKASAKSQKRQPNVM